MEKYESLSVCFRNQIENVHIDSSSIRIKAGSLFPLPVIVPRANTVISWSFTSKYYDIEFSITKEEEDGRSKTLVPYSSYSRDTEHRGKIVAVEAGTYYLVWNNSASWLRERYVDYSVSLHFEDIEEEEKNACSRKILNDIASLQYSIFEADQNIEEKKSELTALKIVSNQRIAKRELLNNELASLAVKEQQCLSAIEECKQQIIDLQNHIHYVHTMAAFLVEDDRIFSFLDSMDMLRLANVNRYLNDASHQDSVWKRLFVTDLEDNLAIAVKNEWLLQKWRLFHTDTPIPSLQETV